MCVANFLRYGGWIIVADPDFLFRVVEPRHPCFGTSILTEAMSSADGQHRSLRTLRLSAARPFSRFPLISSPKQTIVLCGHTCNGSSVNGNPEHHLSGGNPARTRAWCSRRHCIGSDRPHWQKRGALNLVRSNLYNNHTPSSSSNRAALPTGLLPGCRSSGSAETATVSSSRRPPVVET